jgi:hypothetical protein
MGTKLFIQPDQGLDLIFGPFCVTMNFLIAGHFSKTFAIPNTRMPMTLVGAQRPRAGE